MRNIEDYVAIRAAIVLGIIILLFIALGACASEPMTELEQLRAEQIEQERRELFVLWKKMCIDARGYILINKALTCNASQPDCIPHKREWNGRIIPGKRGHPDRLISNSTTYLCARKPI